MKSKPNKAESFEFTAENLARAKKIIACYPEGRQRSAIVPLLDIAQRQNGNWLSQYALEYIAKFLNIAPIWVMEVATFYSMFNLKPVGKYHIQLCGTTPCWLRGAGELKALCKTKLGISEKETSSDGLFTLTEVECLGACVNAPMVQINDDYYEDLTPELLSEIIDNLKAGKKVGVGSQIGRQGSAPANDSGETPKPKKGKG